MLRIDLLQEMRIVFFGFSLPNSTREFQQWCTTIVVCKEMINDLNSATKFCESKIEKKATVKLIIFLEYDWICACVKIKNSSRCCHASQIGLCR